MFCFAPRQDVNCFGIFTKRATKRHKTRQYVIVSLRECVSLRKTPQSYNKKSTYAKICFKFSQKSYFCRLNECFLLRIQKFLRKKMQQGCNFNLANSKIYCIFASDLEKFSTQTKPVIRRKKPF